MNNTIAVVAVFLVLVVFTKLSFDALILATILAFTLNGRTS